MGAFPPVYPPEDLDQLDDKKRQILRNAVMKELIASRQVHRILKRKTQSVFNGLIGRRKARSRRKRK